MRTMLLVWMASLPTGLVTAVEGPELLRDRWGIPHVFAETEESGFFALGYACAEDRILQMELIRRRGAGRLAEIFGPDLVDSDRESRLAGNALHAAQAFGALPAEHQAWLRAYAAGVNAWVASHPEVVARRFHTLAIAPEPWTPADCLVVARGLLSLGSPFDSQPVELYHRYQELAAQVGEAEATRSFKMPVDDSAAIVSEEAMAEDREVYARLKSAPRMSGYTLQGATGDGPKMSHAWAVSGKRSKTGRPILESDPQLPLCSPPFLYEYHLAAGRIDARGLGMPGCPGLFIGFNRRIAWGASALGANAEVVFLEKLADKNAGYRFRGDSLPFQRRLERIRVKGAADVVQEVLTTQHGVVFDSLSSRPSASGEVRVLHDPEVAERGTTVRALLELMTATDWSSFRRALAHYYDPGIHVVYADVEGNIGYHTVVHRPRTARSPRLAQEGWTGAQEIAGRIPLDELPHLLNPPSGFISHANNMPVGSWYPYDLGIGTGGNGHTDRSWRLQQLLEGDRLFGVEDFEALIRRDEVNARVAALLPLARRVVEEDEIDDPAVSKLLESARGWDGRASTMGQDPALRALQNTLTPYRRSGLQDRFGAGGGGVTHLARALAESAQRDGALLRIPEVRQYLLNWLRSAAGGEAPQRGGERNPGAGADVEAADPSRIRIPYQATTPLNLPTVDRTLDLLSPPLKVLDTGTIWSQPGNFYTQIVDLADVDNSRAMIAPGNSEDAESASRTSGIELWVEGRTRPAPLSRGKVEQLGVARFALAAQDYQGPISSPALTVDRVDPTWHFMAAIPPAEAEKPVEPRARPADAQSPQDPRLQAAFRIILRAEGTPVAAIDEQIELCRKIVAGDRELERQLRGAAILGIYLIEESAAGRLKVKYGSPDALERLRTLLRDLGGDAQAPGDKPGAEPERQGAKAAPGPLAKDGLIGYWPLRGDVRDHSGHAQDGVNHGVDLENATFDGRGAFIEIPTSPRLRLGTADFTVSAWVHTAADVDDVIGDVLSLWDADRRRGFSLTIKSTAGGYSSQGDDRHVSFGIDNAQDTTWEDCGRPSPTSNYVSNSLSVFDGHLYAAITDAEKFEDWCHVFRYDGGQKWMDCGRVGDRRTHGAGPMVVHRGSLYAATWTYDWTRVGIQEPLDDFCRVYRYAGETTWEDCGQPGQCRRLFGLASFRGGLYVTAEDGRCYVYAGGQEWRECGKFPNYAHPLGVHDGKLYAGVLNPAGVWAFDGKEWSLLGNPLGAEQRCNQVHALEVYRGRLHATTWPEGHVVRLEDGGAWTDLGRLGDSLEINALNVHNGQLYGGTIPRAEIFRLDTARSVGVPVVAEPPDPQRPRQPARRFVAAAQGSDAWPSVRRFLEPAGYEFKDSVEWARVTSLTTFQGKQFASMGSCTSSRLDAPCDFRGRVYAMQAGRCVSFDRDLGAGWKHLVAVRRGDHLELHVNGHRAATSAPFVAADYELTTDAPMRIGFGEVDYFSGRIREVRLYGRALEAREIASLAATDHGE